MTEESNIRKKGNSFIHYMTIIFLIIAFYSFFLNPAFTFLGGLHTAMLLWPLSILIFHPLIIKGCKNQKRIFISWLCVFLYVLLRTILGGDASFVFIWFALLVEIVVLSFVLVRISIIQSVDLEDVLLCVASLAGMISCLCLFNPDLNTYVKSIQVSTVEHAEQFSFRGFGIGDGLSFTYGVSLGTICALGICNIKHHKWFIFFIPIVAFAVLLNARTGFIPIVLAFVTQIVNPKNIIRNILLSLIVVLSIIIIWNSFFEDLLPGSTAGWMVKFFTELGEGSKGETVSVLLDYVVYPNCFEEWFMGKGINVFYLTGSYRTDIGYLIQLCYGGIFYCTLLYIMAVLIIIPAYKSMPKSLFWTLIISMLLENYKGDFIGRNSAFCCFAVIMVYYAQLNNQHKMIDNPFFK